MSIESDLGVITASEFSLMTFCERITQDPAYVIQLIEEMKAHCPEEESLPPLTPSQEELKVVFDEDPLAHLLTHLPNLPDKACQVSRDLVTELKEMLSNPSDSPIKERLEAYLTEKTVKVTVIPTATWYSNTIKKLVEEEGWRVYYVNVVLQVDPVLSQCVKLAVDTARIYSRHNRTALHLTGPVVETTTSTKMNLTLWILKRDGSFQIFPGTGFVSDYPVMSPQSPDAPMSLLFNKGGVTPESIEAFIKAVKDNNIYGLLPNTVYHDLLVQQGYITTTAAAAADATASAAPIVATAADATASPAPNPEAGKYKSVDRSSDRYKHREILRDFRKMIKGDTNGET
jgi:hypothetical protein